MEQKKSLTEQYVYLFDRLPPLLETMDYENDFYQDLMFDAIINEKPIDETDIENKLKKDNVKYDYVEELQEGELKNEKR